MVISKHTYTKWIKQPHLINQSEVDQLSELIVHYPFCQSSRMLHTKGLQNINSIHFNKSLKITASYSSDRHQLYYLLTQKTNTQTKSNASLKKESTINKHLNNKEQIKESLSIGQPLNFNENETHSFSQWLKLSQANPIKRSNNGLQKKVSLIEDYIANRDRTPPKKEFFSANNQAKQSETFEFDIVTETLAKVYLEQEHYQKAKAAYQQLCLKYPQKSSLFASQIELIDQLIKTNK